ncbi:hypothetical protein F5Y19DRAFT_461999 [Xylariaceae sp. FL1651]|nr:hypothetical protein F5Y19DRAFT_461999 [Xylariaceae sp. FL1651]
MLDTDTYVIDPTETPGLVHADGLTAESAKTTTELLKENNEKYHIFFTIEDHMGVYLHNHIAHHDLTLWALGAKPHVLRSQHDRNTLYMRDAMIVVEPLVQDLEDDTIFKKCLGREENFRNFEKYFIGQIKKRGYQAVLQKYLVGGGDIADDMHIRIYMGYVHGLIHIGLALEFRQPLLLAEGLAQAAVHHDMWYVEYLRGAEALASEAKESPLPLADIIDMEREDEKIRTASSLEFHTQVRKHSGRWAMDKELARDGILPNAKAEILRLAARWRVDPDDVEQATAELINTAVYIVAGAQLPPYECAFDFYLLHCLTASIGHASFLRESSMTKGQKARLLEYTGRICMLTYAGMGCPQLRLDYLCSHRSKLPKQGWTEVFDRACYHEDDGHMSKMIRSTMLAEELSSPYNHLREFRVKKDMFLTAGIAMIDSGSKQPMTWTKHWDFVRGAGYPEAWTRFPKRDY